MAKTKLLVETDSAPNLKIEDLGGGAKRLIIELTEEVRISPYTTLGPGCSFSVDLDPKGIEQLIERLR